jgi:hypothetical protein
MTQYASVRVLVIAQLAEIRQWLDAGKTLSDYHREHRLTVSYNRFARVLKGYMQPQQPNLRLLEQANPAVSLGLTGDNLAHAGASIVSPAFNAPGLPNEATVTASNQEWLTAAEIHALYFEQTGRRIHAIKIGLEARRLEIAKQDMIVNMEGVRRPVVPRKYAKNELGRLFEELDKLDLSTCTKSPACNVPRVSDETTASASEHEWLTATEIHELYFEQTGRRVNAIKIGLEARRLEITKQETVSTIEGIQKPVVLRKYAKGELPKLFDELNKLDSSAYAKSHHYRFWSS